MHLSQGVSDTDKCVKGSAWWMENEFILYSVSPPLSPSAFLLATPCNSLPHSLPPCLMQGDSSNNLIRHLVISSGVVSTLAGQAGSTGSTNGIGSNARFNIPQGIALDAAGTFAVVVRREGMDALREGMRLEEGRGMGIVRPFWGASE
jgi:hypothetical protein